MPAAPELHLPDVSQYQMHVDFAAVTKHNGGAAILRAHNGRRPDGTFVSRRAAAHKAGVRVLGLYQYLVKDRDAVQQAREFVQTVGSLKAGEFAILDLEEGDGDQAQRARQWLAYVDAHLTYPGYNGAWLYSYKAFIGAHGLASFFEDPKRHTWLAAYSATEPSGKGLGHTLWQHADSEAWPGIGKCDCSIFHGTLGQLLAKVCTPPKATPAKPVAHSTAPQPVKKPGASPSPAQHRPAPTPPPVPVTNAQAVQVAIKGGRFVLLHRLLDDRHLRSQAGRALRLFAVALGQEPVVQALIHGHPETRAAIGAAVVAAVEVAYRQVRKVA